MKAEILTFSAVLAISFLFSASLNPSINKNSENPSHRSFIAKQQINENLNLSDSNKKGVNPSRKEIFSAMMEVGKKYSIPPEILFAIAYAESEFKQFNETGSPFVSFDNGIGIMQVTPHVSPIRFDISRAKYDYKYNIEIGARILLEKWKDQETIVTVKSGSGNLLPIVGDMDPTVLENWYFVLWAYNGYAGENNPNALPMYISSLEGVKTKAYQDRVLDLADRYLNIKITKFPATQLPESHIPPVGTSFKTPEPKHYSVISRINLEADLQHNIAEVAIKNLDTVNF